MRQGGGFGARASRPTSLGGRGQPPPLDLTLLAQDLKRPRDVTRRRSGVLYPSQAQIFDPSGSKLRPIVGDKHSGHPQSGLRFSSRTGTPAHGPAG
ncbi:hypothetical protein LIER_11026 [Lithospermum erythrorhizon]|uniref:Uncharacterized protein n=1 Tax=Lithospermum erythrorhizon TaxID=34254 RepID=A0AAV3PLI2_LITER